MTSKSRFLVVTGCIAAAGIVAPLAAEPAAVDISSGAQAPTPAATSPTALAGFAPAANRREHRIDYEHWDEALRWLVLPMGPSIRQGAPRVDPLTGTRRIYGHESRYRLEGNRVAFSYVTPQIRESLSEYRADLERIGTQLDLTALPRNEQLAFWLNLHNVAVIEALAGQYPMTDPATRTFGSNAAALDDAKLVTVDGVALSPRDIREGIVYPNWNDPKVMYGFWRGVIGGPSIQRLAYTGGNVDALLSLSAEEFVSSLRGVERWGGALRVSAIYEEAARFYFGDDNALREHLAKFAREDVRELVEETPQVAYKPLESDLADLARGESQMLISPLSQVHCGGDCYLPGIGNSVAASTRPNPAIQRLMNERAEKLERARKAGIRTGMVIFGDAGYSPDETPPEVE